MIDYPIDFVFPYVNSTSKKWQKTYVDFCRSNGDEQRLNNFNSERYRDWGFLRYMLRGLEAYMPFINKFYIILQAEDQIPEWLDTNKVQVVYHKDFIPEQYLPTYNSTTIEMFLDKIPNLSEHFIYANDDYYVLKPLKAEDFFSEDGKLKIGFRQRVLQDYLQFHIVCCRCFNDVQLAVNGRDSTPNYITPYHEFTPMIKSHITKVNELLGDKIYKNITPFRAPNNHNQYIYPYYEFCIKNVTEPTRTYAYMNMENNIDSVAQIILSSPENTLILNDNERTNVKTWSENNAVRRAFESRYFKMSKFEKKPKVTIGICMYNMEDYIETCLGSIPDRKDIEILILDDKSTDKSIERAQNKLSDFKLAKCDILSVSRNAGVGYGRNVLLDIANGDYIFFLDADDKIDTQVFCKILDNELKDQNILIPKYTRNDGFSTHPETILRGCFVRLDYIGSVRHDPMRRCFEDTDFKKRLKESKGGTLDEVRSEEIVYYYNMPRVGSVTWEHWKERGLPGYQKDTHEWEKWYKGRVR